MQLIWEYNRYVLHVCISLDNSPDDVFQYDRDGMVNPLQYLSQMRQDRGGMIQKTVR